MNDYLSVCRSCGMEFVAHVVTIVVCPSCVAHRETVKSEMTRLVSQAVTKKAKAFFGSIWALFDQGKYLAAAELVAELKLQIQADRVEFMAQKRREAAKKARNLLNKEARRLENRQRALARGGGKKK